MGQVQQPMSVVNQPVSMVGQPVSISQPVSAMSGQQVSVVGSRVTGLVGKQPVGPSISVVGQSEQSLGSLSLSGSQSLQGFPLSGFVTLKPAASSNLISRPGVAVQDKTNPVNAPSNYIVSLPKTTEASPAQSSNAVSSNISGRQTPSSFQELVTCASQPAQDHPRADNAQGSIPESVETLNDAKTSESPGQASAQRCDGAPYSIIAINALDAEENVTTITIQAPDTEIQVPNKRTYRRSAPQGYMELGHCSTDFRNYFHRQQGSRQLHHFIAELLDLEDSLPSECRFNNSDMTFWTLDYYDADYNKVLARLAEYTQKYRLTSPASALEQLLALYLKCQRNEGQFHKPTDIREFGCLCRPKTNTVATQTDADIARLDSCESVKKETKETNKTPPQEAEAELATGLPSVDAGADEATEETANTPQKQHKKRSKPTTERPSKKQEGPKVGKKKIPKDFALKRKRSTRNKPQIEDANDGEEWMPKRSSKKVHIFPRFCNYNIQLLTHKITTLDWLIIAESMPDSGCGCRRCGHGDR